MNDSITNNDAAQVRRDESNTSGEVLDAALRYSEHGLSIIPVGADKRPIIKWENWQTQRADTATIRGWFRNGANVAIVCGGISGGLLAIDFDESRLFDAWRESVGNLANGLVIQKSGKGYHVLLRCPTPRGNEKLAFVADENENSGRRIAIETRGEGGYIIGAPSIHPSGKPYEIIAGDLTAIPFVQQKQTNALLDAARRLDECPLTRQEQERENRAKISSKPRYGASIVDKYNAANSIGELLERHGYRRSNAQRYIRPNGDHSSVTVRDRKSFHHNTNDTLSDGYWHTPFDVFCKLEHGGDLRAAVRAAAKDLGLSKSGPNGAETNQESAGQYLVKDGRISRRKSTQHGEIEVPLCNFAAQIIEEIERDDGADVTRVLRIEGKHADGSPLPTVRVDASQFPGMRWVFPQWGTRAIVEAGQSNQDHLRAAIQYLSPNAATRRVYTHTGWREIGGQMTYLTQSGALGGAPVAVELDKELERYYLPTQPTNVLDAMCASLRFLKIAPLRVTVPLWSAMYLAPLTPILSPNFMLWVYGVTGALKSTLSALALSHFGDFTERDLLMWSATANALEKYAFLVKDAPLLVDDFAPQSDPITARRLEETAARLVRDVGNRTGRARMRNDLSLREVYRPRGLVISTGEQIPDGQSVVARLCTIEIKKGDVDIAKLSEAQDEREKYPNAMAGYIFWLADHWHDLAKTLPNKWRDLRSKARTEDHHLRLPESIASLSVGLDVGLTFALEIGALSAEEAEELREESRGALWEISKRQHRIAEEERPTRVFLTVLADLLAQRKLRLNDVDSPDESGDGDLIGWRDAEYIYLLPSASYHRVAQFARDEGRHFIKVNPLRKELAEEGILETDEGHLTTPKQIGGKLRRVLKLNTQEAEKVFGVSLH